MMMSVSFSPLSVVCLQMVMQDCGHFQFLDEQSTLDRAVCQVGKTPDSVVRLASQAVMIAWGQLMIRERAGARSHSTEGMLRDPRLQDLETLLATLIPAQAGSAGSPAAPLIQIRSKGLQGLNLS